MLYLKDIKIGTKKLTKKQMNEAFTNYELTFDQVSFKIK